MMDVVTELARDGVLSDMLHADDLVLMSETIVGLRNKFLKWMEAFGSKGLNVWENQGSSQQRHHKG